MKALMGFLFISFVSAYGLVAQAQETPSTITAKTSGQCAMTPELQQAAINANPAAGAAIVQYYNGNLQLYGNGANCLAIINQVVADDLEQKKIDKTLGKQILNAVQALFSTVSKGASGAKNIAVPSTLGVRG